MFGILVSRWRIFQEPIEGKSELVEKMHLQQRHCIIIDNKLITRTTVLQDLSILKTKVVQL